MMQNPMKINWLALEGYQADVYVLALVLIVEGLF
jgi:hypothetical protein